MSQQNELTGNQFAGKTRLINRIATKRHGKSFAGDLRGSVIGDDFANYHSARQATK